MKNDRLMKQGSYACLYTDKLRVSWLLTDICNYKCSYCINQSFRKQFTKNSLFSTWDQLRTAADKILMLDRSWYYFHFTSFGETLLHPECIPLIAYLHEKSPRNVSFGAVTNGSRPIEYFREMINAAGDSTFDLTVSIQPEFVNKAHLESIVREFSQQVRLSFSLSFLLEKKEFVEELHGSLSELRKRFPFNLEIRTLRALPDFTQLDPRYTQKDFEWASASSWYGALSKEALRAACKRVYPKPEKRFWEYLDGNCKEIHGYPGYAQAIQSGMLNFQRMWCTQGTNMLLIKPDGRCEGSLCDQTERWGNIFTEDIFSSVAKKPFPSLVHCNSNSCLCVDNWEIMKFADKAEAAFYIEYFKAPLRNPHVAVNTMAKQQIAEPSMRETVLSRLEKIKPIRQIVERINPESTLVVTFSETLESALEHYMGLNPPLTSLPDFVLLDWDGGVPSQWSRLHAVQILPAAEVAVTRKNVCVYAPPEKSLWGKFGMGSTAARLHKAGIRSFMMDAASVAHIYLRKPVSGFPQDRMDEICTVYSILADEESREVFLRAVKAITSGEPGFFPVSDYVQYEHPRVHARPGDVVFEGGVEDGLTTKKFALQVGPSGKVYGFEAVRAYAEAAALLCSDMANVHIENLGLWSSKRDLWIENIGGGSHLSDAPAKGDLCHTISLDEYAGAALERCDMIKLDIEGAELECLKGAMNLIRRHRPKLQISLYHSPSHYLDIPLLLSRQNVGYEFYMGHHGAWLYETCLYAFPAPA